MWLITNLGSAKQYSTWVEVGLRNGLDTFNNPCKCVAYEAFWEDANATDGKAYRHWIANWTPNNSSHSYEIVRGTSANKWNVYVDGKLKGTSTVTGSWTGHEQQIGAEIQANNLADAHSTTWSMTPQYRDGKGNWYLWGGASPGVALVKPPGTAGRFIAPRIWQWWK
jgi:hypothetical protein